MRDLVGNALSDIGARSDAAVSHAHTVREPVTDAVLRDTPARPDYWYGHGYEVSVPLDDERFARFVADGRSRFAGRPDVLRFIILEERAPGIGAALTDLPPGTIVNRERIFVWRSAPVDANVDDARVTPIASDDDAAWETIAMLLAGDAPTDQAAFHRWSAARWRAGSRSGQMHLVGIRIEGELVAYAGIAIAEDGSLARCLTPVTAPAWRRRGFFSACMRELQAFAFACDLPMIVIAAEPDSAQERLYRSLGFEPVSERTGYAISLVSGTTSSPANASATTAFTT